MGLSAYNPKRALIVLAAAVPLLVSMTASAQQSTSGSGLSISPTITEFTLNPGQTANLNITLKDSTNGSINAEGVVTDFASDGTTGVPKLLTQPGASSPNSIKDFIFNLNNIPLDPGQQKNIIVGVHVPDGTPPGGYYGVVRYKAIPVGTNAPAPGQVALTASVGTIVLITVPGDLHNQISLTAIHVYHGTQDASVFVSKPDKFGVEIDNLGNGFAKPFGTVELQNTFGKEVYNYQFNDPKQLGNILPKSTRIFTNPAKGINQIGRYTITVNATYGDGSHILSLKKTFWYIPFWLVCLVLAILAGLILLTVRLYVRHHKDKRHSYRR